jgi:hypothetical protein
VAHVLILYNTLMAIAAATGLMLLVVMADASVARAPTCAPVREP